MQEYTVIVSVEEAAKLIEEGQAAVADCRFWLTEPERGQAAYEEGHLPRAVYFDLDRDLSSPRGVHGGRHPLPEISELAQKLGASGIDRTTTVIAYDDQGGAMASRLWWLLQYIGHEGHVYVMDGGYNAWLEAGHPVSAEVPEIATRSYEPQVRPELVLHVDDIRERLGRPGVVMIDSREADRYAGRIEPIDAKAGHIPGAVNHFWRNRLDEAGQWIPVQAQREQWEPVVQGAEEVIVYCGSGVTACPNLLSLWQAGVKGAKLYAGSWSDWSSYEGNPVATGEE